MRTSARSSFCILNFAFLSHHEVHQFLLDIDHLARRLSLEPFRQLGVLPGESHDFCLARISRHLDLAAQLAVHLDGNRQPITCDERGVVLRPGLRRHTRRLAQPLPEFFGDVRREGREQQHEGLEERPRARLELGHLVREHHHLCDRRVKPQGFQVIRDLLDRLVQQAIKKVTDDLEALRFNTAIAQMMVFTNEVTKLKTRPRALLEPFVLLLSPFAPHIAEELWERLGKAPSVATQPWPEYDPALVARDRLTIPIQVNGKLRSKIEVPADSSEAEVVRLARQDAKLSEWLQGKTPRKVIYVEKKLVNFVV